jgi:hypothetical protein
VIPFTTPGLEVYDALRLFCVVGGIAAEIGMVVQFLALQPGLSPRIQRARATFIVGTFLLLAAEIGVELDRFGKPALPFRLFTNTAGVAVLLLWLVFEQRARRHDPADRLRQIKDLGSGP